MDNIEKEYWSRVYRTGGFVPVHFFADNAHELEKHVPINGNILESIARKTDSTEICRELAFDRINEVILKRTFDNAQKQLEKMGVWRAYDHIFTLRGDANRMYALSNPYVGRKLLNIQKTEKILKQQLCDEEPWPGCKIQVFPHGIYNPFGGGSGDGTIGIVIPEAVIHKKLSEITTTSLCVLGKTVNENAQQSKKEQEFIEIMWNYIMT